MQRGSRVIFDFASWDIVEKYHADIFALLRSGRIFAAVCNEDEALALHRCCGAATLAKAARDLCSENGSALADASEVHCAPTGTTIASKGSGMTLLPETASGACAVHCSSSGTAEAVPCIGLPRADAAAIEAVQAFVTRFCHISVTTLGRYGCVARSADGVRASAAAAQVPAVVDTTGAGDLFTAGFLAGLLRRRSLQRCCELGCAAGSAAVRVVGASLPDEPLQPLCALADAPEETR